jgi:hypothetical protein
MRDTNQMHELTHEFTERKISPWGGIKFFHKTYVTSGIKKYLSASDLPQPGSNRGYRAEELVEGFMTSVVLGARRLEHSGMLRTDEVIKEIFGWENGMASASTFSRFFQRFDLERNDRIFPSLMKKILSVSPIRYMTIDIDSTVITRYGKQEHAERGYNPEKPGRRSHHPILAFCDELKMVVNAWMRTGDSASATEATDFLSEVFTIVEPNNIGLIRGDAGFYGNEVLSHLEAADPQVKYIIRAKLSAPLQRRIRSIRRWHHSSSVIKDASYAEIMYKATGWKSPRRFIIVRTPKVGNVIKHAELFSEYEQLSKFEYKAFVTNTWESAVAVHRRYNQRGDCENRIKELKYDYSIDGFALHNFAAMEAAFRFIMVAFNIMSLFKQVMMTSEKYHRLATIKFQCIAIGSYLVKSGRNRKMKLSAEGKRRHFLEHIFENLEVIRPPYKISNA